MEQLEHLGLGASINGPIHLGNPRMTTFACDVCVNPGFVVRGQGRLEIGSHVHIGHNVEILTTNHNYDKPSCLPYDEVRISKKVVIEDCVWICDRVVISPGVRVGEGAVLAAGAVVSHDVPSMAVVGGAPATVIKYRNRAAYFQLREQQRYLGWPRVHDIVNKRRVLIRRRIPSIPTT